MTKLFDQPLLKSIQQYCHKHNIDPTSTIIFPSEKYSWATNRAYATFTLEGKKWNCTEQYMQYKKIEYIDRTNISDSVIRQMQDKILARKTAEDAINITKEKSFHDNKCVNELLPETWHSRDKYNILLEANLAKFSQNPSLQEKLLATSNQHIIGIGGRCTKWAAINQQGDLGLNWTGRILMETRTSLRAIHNQTQSTGWNYLESLFCCS
jgi:ribA/ribD-fused uncharacterized protein